MTLQSSEYQIKIEKNGKNAKNHFLRAEIFRKKKTKIEIFEKTG